MADTDERFNWGPLVADLAQRKATALSMGGAERVERQRSLGKLPVRERLDLFCDPGTFVEYGMLADHMDPNLAAKGSFAADGCITGVGEVDGRPVAVVAYDFTIMAVPPRAPARCSSRDSMSFHSMLARTGSAKISAYVRRCLLFIT